MRTHNIYLVKGNIWYRQKSITRVGAIAQKGSQSHDRYCNKKENLSWISFITARVRTRNAMDLKEVQYLLFHGYE